MVITGKEFKRPLASTHGFKSTDQWSVQNLLPDTSSLEMPGLATQ